MKLKIFQIDAFANAVFEGNPAAICPLQKWLPDKTMQALAMENNLSETAFFVPADEGYQIRWFTPTHEVDLCGHATLASAYVIFNILEHQSDRIVFDSRSGLLTVTRDDDWLTMDFPGQPPHRCEIPGAILQAFSDTPLECLKAEDYIVVFPNDHSVIQAKPDLRLLADLDLRGVAITAPGRNHDFVSRFFAPKYGINEDPVTGSAFTQLVPYWAGVSGKTQFHARQVSQRGGEVKCELVGDRVKISGRAVQYMTGTAFI